MTSTIFGSMQDRANKLLRHLLQQPLPPHMCERVAQLTPYSKQQHNSGAAWWQSVLAADPTPAKTPATQQLQSTRSTGTRAVPAPEAIQYPPPMPPPEAGARSGTPTLRNKKRWGPQPAAAAAAASAAAPSPSLHTSKDATLSSELAAGTDTTTAAAGHMQPLPPPPPLPPTPTSGPDLQELRSMELARSAEVLLRHGELHFVPGKFCARQRTELRVACSNRTRLKSLCPSGCNS